MKSIGFEISHYYYHKLPLLRMKNKDPNNPAWDIYFAHVKSIKTFYESQV